MSAAHQPRRYHLGSLELDLLDSLSGKQQWTIKQLAEHIGRPADQPRPGESVRWATMSSALRRLRRKRFAKSRLLVSRAKGARWAPLWWRLTALGRRVLEQARRDDRWPGECEQQFVVVLWGAR